MLHGKEKLSNMAGALVDEITGKIVLDNNFKGNFPITGFNNIEVSENATVGNEMQAWHDISVRPGAFVNGNLFSDRTVTVYGGKNTPTIIIGDVIAVGDLFISSDKGSSEFVYIYGNVFGNKITIDAPNVLIRGDVYAEMEFVSKPKNSVFITGRIRVGLSADSLAKVDIKNTGSFGLLVYGDLVLRENITLLEPIMVIKYGKLQTSKKLQENFKIRVLSETCSACDKVKNPLSCELFSKNKCFDYQYLSNEDVFTYRDRKGNIVNIISWYWRSSFAQLTHSVYVYMAYKAALSRPKKVLLIDKIIDSKSVKTVIQETSNEISRPEFTQNDVIKFLENRVSSNMLTKDNKDVKFVLELLKSRLLQNNEEEEIVEMNKKILEVIPMANLEEIETFKSISKSLAKTTEVTTKTVDCNECEGSFLWREGQDYLCPKCGSDDLIFEAGIIGIFDQIKEIYEYYYTDGKGNIDVIVKKGNFEDTIVIQYLQTIGCFVTTNNMTYYKHECIRKIIFNLIKKKIKVYTVEELSKQFVLHKKDVKQIFIDLSFEQGMYLCKNANILINYSSRAYLVDLGTKLIEKGKLKFSEFFNTDNFTENDESLEFARFLINQLEIGNCMTNNKAIYSNLLFSEYVVSIALEMGDFHIDDLIINSGLEPNVVEINKIRFILEESYDDNFAPNFFFDTEMNIYVYSSREKKIVDLLQYNTKVEFEKLREILSLTDDIIPIFLDRLLSRGLFKGSISKANKTFAVTDNIVYTTIVEKSITLGKETEEIAPLEIKYSNPDLTQSYLIEKEGEKELDLTQLYRDIRLKKVENENRNFELDMVDGVEVWKFMKNFYNYLDLINYEEPSISDNSSLGLLIFGGSIDDNSSIFIEIEIIAKNFPLNTSLLIKFFSNDDDLRGKYLDEINENLKSKFDKIKSEQFPFLNACKNCGTSFPLEEITSLKKKFYVCSNCEIPNFIPKWMKNI